MAHGRGTICPRYIRYPSMIPLPIAAQNAGPMMNVHSWTATSDLPIAMYCAGSAPAVEPKSWRIVTTESRLMSPTTISVDSSVRMATYPIAMLPLTRRTMR